jgi:hypothetical protein
MESEVQLTCADEHSLEDSRRIANATDRHARIAHRNCSVNSRFAFHNTNESPDYPRASFAPLPDIALPDTARVDNRRSLRI